MFPVNATNVTPMSTIDHTRGGVPSVPNSSRKKLGTRMSAIALRPNTEAPTRSVCRRNVIPRSLGGRRTDGTGQSMSPRLEGLFKELEHRDSLDNHQVVTSTPVSDWGTGAQRVPLEEIRRT